MCHIRTNTFLELGLIDTDLDCLVVSTQGRGGLGGVDDDLLGGGGGVASHGAVVGVVGWAAVV